MKDRTSKSDLLKNLPIPVLFIIGKEDKRIPIENIKDQILLPSHAEILILEYIGHMGYIEAESITLNSVKSFLERTYIK